MKCSIALAFEILDVFLYRTSSSAESSRLDNLTCVIPVSAITRAITVRTLYVTASTPRRAARTNLCNFFAGLAEFADRERQIFLDL